MNNSSQGYQGSNSRSQWSFNNLNDDDPDPTFFQPKNNLDKLKLWFSYLPLLIKYKKGIRNLLWRN